MAEKIKETQEKLKQLGYYASESLAKMVLLFENAGKRSTKSIPTLLLKGKSGAGKTFLVETFSKMVGSTYDDCFIQCFPRMGAENLQLDINPEGYIKQDVDNLIKKGVLLKALEMSQKEPVVLTIDELDKARPEVDSFLLDFLENGRLSTGTETFRKGEFPIYTIITSNDKREIDDALLNRCKKIEVPRPSKEMFLEILGLPEDHYIGWIYDKCPDFSIRQARQYLDDLEILGTEIDEDALSQYINLDDLDVMSLADLQRVSKLEKGSFEFELPDLERCRINLSEINSSVAPVWVKLLQDTVGKFEFESRENKDYDDRTEDVYVNIRDINQLEILKQYGLSDIPYKGWFAQELSEEELDSENIIWAGNISKNNGTRFGIKLDGDRMFRIAMSKGKTFVYFDSSSENTIENYLGQTVSKIEPEYETDSEYDNDRDYDEYEE